MFGFRSDPRKKKLKELIELIGRANQDSQMEVLRRLGAASATFHQSFEGIENFADLKFALRPDQAEAMADKSVEFQKVVLNDARANQLDEMAFFFCEASLRHKAGAAWVDDRSAKLIDGLIATAENLGA